MVQCKKTHFNRRHAAGKLLVIIYREKVFTLRFQQKGNIVLDSLIIMLINLEKLSNNPSLLFLKYTPLECL